MRKLIVMFGAPASGKDHFLKKLNVPNQIITPDDFRQLVDEPTLSINEDGDITMHTSQKADRVVWQAVYASIEARMRKGKTIIVNGTHLYSGAFAKYKKLSQEYGYKIAIVDTMRYWFDKFNWDEQKVTAQLIKNNYQRSSMHIVPENIIRTNVQRYIDRITVSREHPAKEHWISGLPEGAKYFAVGEENMDQAFINYIKWQDTDMSKFKRIKIIGDVHGDFDALQKVFDDHQKGDAYIFVGDYLDRGTKSVETFKFITSIGGNNLFFLRGNHETGWEKWVRTGKPSGQFSYDSLPKLRHAFNNDNQLKKTMKKFLDNIKAYVKFDFNGQTFFVTHAGIEPALATAPWGEMMPEEVFVEGLGPNNDPYARDIDTAWAKQLSIWLPANVAKKQINVHGHRNSFNRFVEKQAYNLTDDEKFRWLVVDQDGIHPHEIDRIDVHPFTQELENNENVQQKQIADGITANNFTRRAFNRGIWDSMTTKARGLFTRDGQIVGRGFDKFFQIGQRPEDTLESLVFPVIVEKKWNGFLAVTFFDKQQEKIQVFSKGGGVKFSKLARQALKKTGVLKKLATYFSSVDNQDTSVLFEIIDPINDPHIIKHDEVQTHPLAIVDNNVKGSILNLNDQATNQERQTMEQLIHDSNFYAQANNLAELKQILNDYEQKHPLTEGLVLYGQNKLLKYKSKFYLKAKELRSAMANPTKQKFYYGAEDWFKFVKDHHITEFSPDLALKLYKEEI